MIAAIETHTMNFDSHYFIADGGMFKAVFLSPACGYLNALKLKKMFSSGIENLWSTKFLDKNLIMDLLTIQIYQSAINKYFGK